MLWGSGIVFTGIICLSTLGIFLFYQSLVKSENEDVATVTSTPTPSPTPAFEKGTVTLEVLNGSGKKGEASRIGGLLTTAGFSVVSVGNAPTKVPKTVMYIRKPFAFDAQLQKAIEPVISASLAGELTEGSASARIIIGEK